jgi:rod shape-determining protein MreC
LFKFLRTKSFWSVLITFVILLIFMKLSSSNRQEITGLERMIQAGFAPLQIGIDKLQLGLNQVGFFVMGGKELQQELQAIKTQNEQLNLENMQLREAAIEVERLRGLLAYQQAQQSRMKLEAARVVARTPNNWYKTLTINKGTASGVMANMAVITPVGLVGKVVSANANSAQVWLITDRQMAVGAILQSNRDTKGIVEGMGNNGILRMINIPYYSNIDVGEKVVSSGLSENYPAGIDVGVVQEVKKEANGLVLSATVAPAVNFDQLEEVLVVKQFSPVVEPGGEGVQP